MRLACWALAFGVGVWATPAGAQVPEGGRVTAKAGQFVWYGVPGKWRSASVAATGTYVCDAATLGGDPAPGEAKQCHVSEVGSAFNCMPSQFGGTGTGFVKSVSLMPLEMWAAWKCGDKPQYLVCAGSGCLGEFISGPPDQAATAAVMAKARAALK